MKYILFRKCLGWTAVVGSAGLLIFMAATGEWLLRAIVFLPFVFLWGVHELRQKRVAPIDQDDMRYAGIEEVSDDKKKSLQEVK